jgi:hypothetical protein
MRVFVCGGLLVLLLVGGELHLPVLPLLVRGRLPMLVGARLLLLLLQHLDIGLLLLGLPLPLLLLSLSLLLLLLLLLLLAVVLRLLVGD